jgi:hypothetical protein
MNTEPKSFKDISIKGILLALLIFAVTMGIEALAAYHIPNQIKFIGDLTLSFLATIAFLFVMNDRDKAIKVSKDTTGIMASGYKKFIQKLLILWVTFFILISIKKLMILR